jgi:hypothetical protein
MNKKNLIIPKKPLITPDHFYSKESEKTKLNWFLFEYAAEFDSKIKKPLRAKLKRQKIDDKKIAELCIHYAKHMKELILDQLSGKIKNVVHSYQPIEEFLPLLDNRLVNDLLNAAYEAWESITEMCVRCPTRCISEKDLKAHMFNDPLYYE